MCTKNINYRLAALFMLTSLFVWPVVVQAGEKSAVKQSDATKSNTDTLKLTVQPLMATSRLSLTDHKPRRFIFADPDWFNWGGSVIESTDGKFHMYYARWPRELGFNAWLTHSQVAHAVADRAEGPYRYVDTAIKSRGKGHWDQVTAHNPKIKLFEGKYYLYYISTNGPVTEKELPAIAKTGYSHKKRKPLRTNQRTGVAVADSLNGPWHRLDKPIVEPAGPITTLTVNPAITRGPDGTYFMIVKGDKPNEKRFIRNQALATASSPVGPFKIAPKPVIDTFDTEDASMWYDAKRKRFYAVFHAHTHIGLITSTDGFNWGKAKHYKVTTKQLSFDDGTKWKPARLERPFVLLDKTGQPSHLYLAAKNGNDSVNIAVPLRCETIKEQK